MLILKILLNIANMRSAIFIGLCCALFVFPLVGCEGGINRDLSANPAPQGPGDSGGNNSGAGQKTLGPSESFQWSESAASGGVTSVTAQVVQGQFNSDGQGCLAGTGTLSLPPRPSVNDSWNLGLKLHWSTGSEVRIFLYAQALMKNAFIISLNRGAGNFGFSVTAQGESEDWSGLTGLNGLFNKDQVQASIDIHHDEAHRQFAHLVFFDDRNQVVMDSGRDTAGTPGKGLGREIFLELRNVKVCAVAVRPATRQD